MPNHYDEVEKFLKKGMDTFKKGLKKITGKEHEEEEDKKKKGY